MGLGHRNVEPLWRYAMAMQVARAEGFLKRNGRLPVAQRELSESFRGMAYARIDSARYRITGVDGAMTLRYRSDSSLQAFLGSSLMSIRERRKQ